MPSRRSLSFFSSLIIVISLHLSVSAQPPPHPFLLLNKDDIARIRKEIADSTWKRISWLQLKRSADGLLEEKIELPPRGGNWEQYYVGPKSGYDLVRGRQIGDWRWEHRDTATGETFLGDTSNVRKDYDGVIISLIHNTWAIGVLQLGLAYQLSSDARYAQKARDILLAYAAIYPGLPASNKRNDTAHLATGRGKLYRQNLNESQWLIDIVQGADLIWDILNRQEKEKIVRQIFYPAVEVLDIDQSELRNIQCWQNTAIGLVGFFTGDRKLITRAMEDTTYGFLAQVTKGVGDDGFWVEPTLNYHFYTLNAFIQLYQAAHHYGYPVSPEPFRKMFSAPLDMANGALWIPAFNDSKPMLLTGQENYLYEWGYTTFHESRYAYILGHHPRRETYANLGPQFTGWSLLFGTVMLPAAPGWKPESRLFPNVGIGMLSAGTGKNNLSLYMKFNTHLGTHTHQDNFAFGLLKGAEHVAVLSGNPNYGSFLNYNWYRNSVSSNTFLLDMKTQKPALGTCLYFSRDAALPCMMVETSNAYDSTDYIRTACLLNSDLALIVDQVKMSKAPALWDIAYHQAGIWKVVPPGEKWQEKKVRGYRLIRDGMQATGLQELNLSTRLSSGREVMISAVQDSAMNVIAGYGKQYMHADVPVALFRRMTNNGVMAWCISTDGKKIRLQLDSLKGIHGEKLSLSVAARITVWNAEGRKWSIVVNPYKVAIDGQELWKDRYFIIGEQ